MKHNSVRASKVGLSPTNMKFGKSLCNIIGVIYVDRFRFLIVDPIDLYELFMSLSIEWPSPIKTYIGSKQMPQLWCVSLNFTLIWDGSTAILIMYKIANDSCFIHLYFCWSMLWWTQTFSIENLAYLVQNRCIFLNGSYFNQVGRIVDKTHVLL